MNHKPWCATNIQCAVYHNNGICSEKKECNCNPEVPDLLSVELEKIQPQEKGTCCLNCRWCGGCVHSPKVLHTQCSNPACECHTAKLSQEKEIDKEEFIKWCALQPTGMLLDFSEQWFEKGRAADRAALESKIRDLCKPDNGERPRFGYNQAIHDVLALLHSPEKN